MKKFLSFFTAIERSVSIYRDYSSLTYVWKSLSCIGVIFELAWPAFNVISRMSYFTTAVNDNTIPLIVYAVNVVYSISIIFLALYNSKKNQILITYLLHTHSCLTMDASYLESLNRKYKSVIYMYATNCIYVTVVQFYHYIDGACFSCNFSVILLNTINNIHSCLHQIRIVTQWILIYSLMHILSEQLVSLTSEIPEENVTVNSTASEVLVSNDLDFDKWAVIYRNIKTCSDLINTIFGLQITFYLMATSLFYICIFYSLIYTCIQGSILPVHVCVIVSKIIFLKLLVLNLCRSAQRVRNCVDELRRRLGRLLLQSVSTNMQNYKEIKNLLGLISNQPIRTQAVPSIDVDMTLLPKYIMFFTSYTILALQINDVV